MYYLNILGSVASLIGLIFTFIVLVRVHNIEKHFSSKARLPEYHKSFKVIIKNLVDHQRNKNSPAIRAQLRIARAKMTDMRLCIDKQRKKRVSYILEELDIHLGTSDETLWQNVGLDIAALNEIVETLNNCIKDMQWRVPNA